MECAKAHSTFRMVTETIQRCRCPSSSRDRLLLHPIDGPGIIFFRKSNAVRRASEQLPAFSLFCGTAPNASCPAVTPSRLVRGQQLHDAVATHGVVSCKLAANSLLVYWYDTAADSPAEVLIDGVLITYSSILTRDIGFHGSKKSISPSEASGERVSPGHRLPDMGILLNAPHFRTTFMFT